MTRLKQILIPVAVIATGILGAFATQVPAKNVQSPFALDMGWIDTPNPCTISVLCQDSGGDLCTVTLDGVVHQAKGKFTTNGQCIKTLYRI